MSIDRQIRDLVRQRADFACEFCGVTETGAGGELTIDHYHPSAKGGSDDLANLIYCCSRCNLYKLDYFPSGPNDPSLWNPRMESFSDHFIELDNGTLHALTPVGEFTLRQIRLNRPSLVEYRQQKRQDQDNLRNLERYKELVLLLERLNNQLAELTREQQRLLEEQQRLLKYFLSKK
jgi:hypothetical protein